MARYTGPSARLCRREGMHLSTKGTKCERGKCAHDKRSYPPGQHGQLRTKQSDYGVQLREKQKVKRMYGMLERQFRRYFQVAQKSKGVTGAQLLILLERRLDNTLYRAGFATSRREGRQLVGHKGTVVNGKAVNIASFQISAGDKIQISPARAGQVARVKANLDRTKDRPVPAWVSVDPATLTATIVRLPEKDDIGLPIQEQLIVELYSK